MSWHLPEGRSLAIFMQVYVYGLNLKARWRLRHIPGPRPSWLLGNLRQVGGACGMQCAADIRWRHLVPKKRRDADAFETFTCRPMFG